MSPIVQPFYDLTTGTMTYVVYERAGAAAAVVDAVLDYDPKAARTSTHSADAVIAFVRKQPLSVEWILETHAHADHLSAAPYLQRELGSKIAIGESIRTVQGVFKKIFDLEPEFRLDGSQFDHLFADGEQFKIGAFDATAIYVPGHMHTDMAYRIGDELFVGDTLFMPDLGTARCDFPGGDARDVPFDPAACSRSRPRHACSSATTTRPKRAARSGKPRCASNVSTTCTSAAARARTNSSRCARPAMRRSACRR